MAPIAKALKYLTVPAIDKHTATIIFAHGLGDTGQGWEPVAKMLNRDPSLNHVKWILPHSPQKQITANMGMSMPAWFDIYSFNFDKETKEDEKGMLSSVQSLNDLISAEVEASIEPDRIVIGGFSQGGALSLLTGLTSGRKLAGVVVLSGWLPIHKSSNRCYLNIHHRPPSSGATEQRIHSSHIEWGKIPKRIYLLTAACKLIKDNEVNGLVFKSYQGMQHSACEEELQDLASWPRAILPKEKSAYQKQDGQL
ncbi:lysophospholipase I [Amanita muscaria]